MGAVLEHIIKRRGVSQIQLATILDMYPQRVNDYIKGKRRITPEISFNLESVLDIGIKGFFYSIQANHDIYEASVRQSDVKDKPDLSKIRNSIFWDTVPDNIDWTRNSRMIIQRVFEYGDSLAIGEIVRFYGAEYVKKMLSEISDTRLKIRRDANINKYLNETSL